MLTNLYIKASNALRADGEGDGGVVVGVEESDLGLNPDFSAPWMSILRDVAGWTVASLFVISGILMAVGVFQFGVAKFASNSRGQESGVKNFIFGFVGVIGLGAVGGLIVWATDFEPF